MRAQQRYPPHLGPLALSGPAVSEAINDPDSPLARLAGTEPDDRRLANELFLRILNRPARDPELDLLSRW